LPSVLQESRPDSDAAFAEMEDGGEEKEAPTAQPATLEKTAKEATAKVEEEAKSTAVSSKKAAEEASDGVKTEKKYKPDKKEKKKKKKEKNEKKDSLSHEAASMRPSQKPGRNEEKEEDGTEDASAGQESEVSFGALVEQLEQIAVSQHGQLPVFQPAVEAGLSTGREPQSNVNRITEQYAKQVDVAQSLLKKIETALTPEALNKFTQVAVYIQLPNIVSLYNQTCNRLSGFFKTVQSKEPHFFCDKDEYATLSEEEKKEKRDAFVAQLVFKAGTGKEGVHERDHAKLIQRIKDEPETLFLIFHDEAHFQATLGGFSDRYINHPLIRDSPNVIILFVTATPFWLVASHRFRLRTWRTGWRPMGWSRRSE